MSDPVHHAYFVREFGDGKHAFCLALGEIRELQIKCKIGINGLYLRVLRGDWFVDDLREIIRVALVGGGMTPIEALHLVERYVDHRPLLEFYGIALDALTRVLVHTDEESTQKKSEEDRGETANGSMATTLMKSTETVQ